STSKTPSYTKSVSWQHHLIFDCVSANREVKINEEFQDYAWVKPEDLVHYDLNVATRKTLRLKGLL
ncbi:hypothetical protein FSH65_025055, partial [Escherichia coli]|nr:hypothetical protein [Escherichia coli]